MTDISDSIGGGGRARAYVREVSPVMALDSLRSEICPACGKSKGKMKSFCFKCFTSLTTGRKKSLYLRMGHGYEIALRNALNALGATGIRMPFETSTYFGDKPPS